MGGLMRDDLYEPIEGSHDHQQTHFVTQEQITEIPQSVNEDMPRISLVTPSLNQSRYLEQTIKSVISQRYPNIQYCIVDGGSTDGTFEIIKRYKHEIDFVIIEADSGPAQAINRGLSRCNGEILGWLNADDTLLPGALFAISDYFRDNPNIEWASGKAKQVDENGMAAAKNAEVEPTGEMTLEGALLREKTFRIPQPATFWRRSVTEKVGLLDERYNKCMDFEFWCRLLSEGMELGKIDKMLATQRLHGVSKRNAHTSEHARAMLEVERQYFWDIPLRERKKLWKHMGFQHRELAVQRAKPGKPWGALFAHPWWILSRQVRDAIFSKHRKKIDFEPDVDAWEQLWRRPGGKFAHHRFDKPRAQARYKELASMIEHHFDEDQKLRIVELGAGEGDLSIALADMGHSVTMVDFSPTALQHAQARFEKMQLSSSSIQNDVFDFAEKFESQFDVVISMGLAEHYSGQKRQDVIDIHYSLLKPNGITFISVPSAKCWPYRFAKAWAQFRGRWNYGFELPFTKGELRKKANKCGFEDFKFFKTGFAAAIDVFMFGLLSRNSHDRREWCNGPGFLNSFFGWDLNMIAVKSKTAKAKSSNSPIQTKAKARFKADAA